MTDKAYLLETLREDFPLCCGRSAAELGSLWLPPHPFLKHLAILYAAKKLLPQKLQTDAGLERIEAQELADILRLEEIEQFLGRYPAGRFSERAAAFHADCLREPLTVERIASLLLQYRNRSEEFEPDDEVFITMTDLDEVAKEYLQKLSTALKRMRLRTEPPESEVEKQKRLKREERKWELWEAQKRASIASIPAAELKAWHIHWVDDVEKLCQILRTSEDDRLIEMALDRIHDLNRNDIDIVRSCLPGKCTWTILTFLCKQEEETPYRYLTLNHMVKEIVPALQREGRPESVDLLDALYYRKYRHYINQEQGLSLDYWEALSQFNAAKTPEEAFRNIDPYYYDRWYEIDDSDEMSYISSLHNVPFSIDGYDLHRYRLKCLCEADLLTDED